MAVAGPAGVCHDARMLVGVVLYQMFGVLAFVLAVLQTAMY